MNLLCPRVRERWRARHHSKFGTGPKMPAVRDIVMVTIADLDFAHGRHSRYDVCLPEREVWLCRNLTWSSSSTRTSPSAILMRSWNTPTRALIYHLWTAWRSTQECAWGFITPAPCWNGSRNGIRNTSIKSGRLPRGARWKWWAADFTSQF